MNKLTHYDSGADLRMVQVLLSIGAWRRRTLIVRAVVIEADFGVGRTDRQRRGPDAQAVSNLVDWVG